MDVFRYEIETKLGDGGLGEVYLARDLLSGKKIALKVINWPRLNTPRPVDADFRRKIINNFVVESKAHARLSELTKHVVEVFDIGCENDLHYLAMEHMTGGNLLPKLGRCSLHDAKQIVRQAGIGLEAAHKHGILHCDISPQNILGTGTAQLYKLSDFGLLTLVDSHLVSNGGTSLLRGGKAYWQPVKVLTGETKASEWADLYSLALVFHGLLIGNRLPIENGLPRVTEPLVARGVQLSPSVAVFLRDVFSGAIQDADRFIKNLDRLN